MQFKFWQFDPIYKSLKALYFLRFKKVGTLDWARSFPLAWPMAYHRPWALAELTQHRPFVNTGRLIVNRRKLPS